MRMVFALALGSFLSGAASGASQLTFDNCSPAAKSELRTRIFKSQNDLHELVVSRDLLHLSICESAGATGTVARISDRLAKDYVLETREIGLPDHPARLRRAAKDACGGPPSCKVELFRHNAYTPKIIVPFSKSGGLPFAQFLGHIGVQGHYEISGKALSQSAKALSATWSTSALHILQDASRDADFYEWSNPAAHAQTRNHDKTAMLDPAGIKSGPGDFENWTRKQLANVTANCKQGKVREALYMLGYALHGIQDLVFHEGISNAEHSFRDFVEDKQIDARDHYPEKMALAVEATSSLLLAFRPHLENDAPGCWDKMMRYAGPPGIATSTRETLLGKAGKDFGIAAYFEYRSLSTTIRSVDPDSTGSEADYFISRPWLAGRQRTELNSFIERITTTDKTAGGQP